MKVWINKRYGSYTGGMIIVAANSAEEAHETFHNDCDYRNMYCQKDDGRYYDSRDWEEVPLLTYDGYKPCVIDEDGYTE